MIPNTDWMKPVKDSTKREAYIEFKRNISKSIERSKRFKIGHLQSSDLFKNQIPLSLDSKEKHFSRGLDPINNVSSNRIYNDKYIEINDKINATNINYISNTEVSPKTQRSLIDIEPIASNQSDFFLSFPDYYSPSQKNTSPQSTKPIPLKRFSNNMQIPLLKINFQKGNIIASLNTEKSEKPNFLRSSSRNIVRVRNSSRISNIEKYTDSNKIHNLEPISDTRKNFFTNMTPKKATIPMPDYLNYSEYLKDSDFKNKYSPKIKNFHFHALNKNSIDHQILSDNSLTLTRTKNNHSSKYKYDMIPAVHFQNSFEIEIKDNSTKRTELSDISLIKDDITHNFALETNRKNKSTLNSIDKIKEPNKTYSFLESKSILGEPIISLPSLRVNIKLNQYKLNKQSVVNPILRKQRKNIFFHRLKDSIDELEKNCKLKSLDNKPKIKHKVLFTNYEGIRNNRRLGLIQERDENWIQNINDLVNLNKIVKKFSNTPPQRKNENEPKKVHTDNEERVHELDYNLLCKLNDYKQSYQNHIEIKTRNLDKYLASQQDYTVDKLIQKNKKDQENYSQNRIPKDVVWYKNLIDKICRVNYGINEGVMQLFDKIKFLLERGIELNKNDLILILNEIEDDLFKNDGFLYVLLRIGKHIGITNFDYFQYFQGRKMLNITKILKNLLK